VAHQKCDNFQILQVTHPSVEDKKPIDSFGNWYAASAISAAVSDKHEISKVNSLPTYV